MTTVVRAHETHDLRHDWPWLLLAVAAVGIAVAGFVFAWQESRRTEGWSETTGYVVSVEHHDSGDSDDWDTVIRFDDSDGIEHTFDSEHGSRRTSVGDAVPVKYPPRDPGQAQTSADTTAAVMLRVMFGVGGIAVAVWAVGQPRGWWRKIAARRDKDSSWWKSDHSW